MKHVQFLFQIADIAGTKFLVIDTQFHIQQVEAAQEIADSSPSIKIICAGQDNILDFKRFG